MPYPLPLEPEQLGELTHDAIAGDFRITQRRDGHRYSIDDVLTAHIAANTRPEATRCLELGSGIIHGTIDRVGRDHLDIAVHERGTPRRESEVRQHRVVPLAQLRLVRLVSR